MSNANADSVKKLIEDLRSENVETRKQAIFNLGEMKVKEAVNELCRMLKEDSNKVVRNNAARALGKIGDPVAVDILSETIFDKDYYIRLNSTWSLGKIKDKRGVEPLLRLIKGGGAKIFSESGAESEITRGDPNSEILKTDGMRYHDVQISAIKALGEIKDERAVGPLIAEFRDEQGTIRSAIALSLAKIGSKEAIPSLIEALNDSIWYVRRDAAIALGELKDMRSVDALINLLSDKYEEVAQKSADAIEKIGSLAIGKTFLLRPSDKYVQNMIKRNFKSKEEIMDVLLKAADLEEDSEKREKLKSQIKKKVFLN